MSVFVISIFDRYLVTHVLNVLAFADDTPQTTRGTRRARTHGATIQSMQVCGAEDKRDRGEHALADRAKKSRRSRHTYVCIYI